MKRRTVYYLTLFIFASLLNSCVYYSKIAIPEDATLKPHKQKIQHVKKSKIGFRFFTIPASIPSGMNLINEAVAEARGDGMVNVEVTFSEFSLFFPLFTFPKVTIEGDVVKRVKKE